MEHIEANSISTLSGSVQQSEATQNSSTLQSSDVTQNMDKMDSNNKKGSMGILNKNKRKKKAPRDKAAPRQPLTGYVRYLSHKREKVRSENPTLPYQEITKILAQDWMNLAHDEKQQYLVAAEQDRERYVQEMNAYKKTEAYKSFNQKQKNKKLKENIKEQPEEIKESEKESEFGGFDIPIFTEEFLDHNKAREAELRQLRKSNTDYEQQNAIIQKHMENMQSAVEKLMEETRQQQINNNSLQSHLQQLRVTLTNSFVNVALPGTGETPTIQTIDSYMTKLHTLLLDSANQQLAVTVRDIIANKLDIQAL